MWILMKMEPSLVRIELLQAHFARYFGEQGKECGAIVAPHLGYFGRSYAG